MRDEDEPEKRKKNNNFVIRRIVWSNVKEYLYVEANNNI